MAEQSPPAKRKRSNSSDSHFVPTNNGPITTSNKDTNGDRLSHDEMQAIASFVQSKTDVRPKLGIICGSGLGGLADDLDKDKPKDVLRYEDIPHFPSCQVSGHKGNLVFGYISGQPTVCMQGRIHFYEGQPAWKITLPVIILKHLGVETLVVTNAAGGLNTDFKVGDIMIMKDHINMVGMSGFNPLVGLKEERFGSRFTPMTSAYDSHLRQLTHRTAKELNMSHFLREGVYVYLSGPSYETPAEARLLRMLGADTVGMSTAPEVVMAKHCGMRVLGISLVTNMVIQEYDSHQTPPSHEEVKETGAMRQLDMQRLVKAVISKMAEDEDDRE